MDKDSTTPNQDNPENQAPEGTENDQTVDNGNDNLEPSESTDDDAADGDKSDAGGDSEDNSSPKLDDDLDDWIEKRGLAKPENDEQKQKYQDLRNEQREFTRQRQAEKDAENAKDLSSELDNLKKDVVEEEDEDEDDELSRDVKHLKDAANHEKVTRLQSEFYLTNKVTEEEHKAIKDVLTEKVNRPATKEGKAKALEVWSDPASLPDLLDIARARIAKATDMEAVKEKAAEAERKKVAQESHANSTGRGAKNVHTGEKTPEQQRLERFSTWD